MTVSEYCDSIIKAAKELKAIGGEISDANQPLSDVVRSITAIDDDLRQLLTDVKYWEADYR